MANPEILQILDQIFGFTSSLQDIKEGLAKKNSLLVPKIYKYRSLDRRSIENVCEDLLWFDNPKNMNDPYECRFRFDNFADVHKIDLDAYKFIMGNDESKYDKRIIDELRKGALSYNQLLPQMHVDNLPFALLTDILLEKHLDTVEVFNQQILKFTHFCSFSARYNSGLMWTHYTNNHKGFCLEYDIENEPKNSHFRNMLYPIIYTNELFDISPIFYNEEAKRAFENKKYNNLYLNNPIFRKSEEWSYENEWRIVFPHGGLERPSAVKTPKPTSILLGCNFFNQFNRIPKLDTDEHRHYLQAKAWASILIEYCATNNIELYLMKFSTMKYEMEKSVISTECARNLLKSKNPN